jgi:16S rRNA processing protein RimM
VTAGDRVAVGRIVGPHGVRGEVRVRSYGLWAQDMAAVKRLFVGDRAYPVRGVRGHAQRWLVRLAGVDSREAAQSLQGQEVWLERGLRPPLPQGRYYVSDLVGMQVQDPKGKALGHVTQVEAMPGQDLLHVRTPGGQEVLVPAARALVRWVDVEGRVMVVDVPQGLFPEGEGGEEDG